MIGKYDRLAFFFDWLLGSVTRIHIPFAERVEDPLEDLIELKKEHEQELNEVRISKPEEEGSKKDRVGCSTTLPALPLPVTKEESKKRNKRTLNKMSLFIF